MMAKYALCFLSEFSLLSLHGILYAAGGIVFTALQQLFTSGHHLLLLVILNHHPTFQMNVTAEKPLKHD
jgi:hypothetical protein